MDVLKELGAYSVLLEMQSKPGLQALGKRLGEIADIVAKEQHSDAYAEKIAAEERAWLSVRHENRYAVPGAEPVNPAPTPEAVLVKELAGWWQNNSHKEPDYETRAALCQLAERAFRIFSS